MSLSRTPTVRTDDEAFVRKSSRNWTQHTWVVIDFLVRLELLQPLRLEMAGPYDIEGAALQKPGKPCTAQRRRYAVDVLVLAVEELVVGSAASKWKNDVTVLLTSRGVSFAIIEPHGRWPVNEDAWHQEGFHCPRTRAVNSLDDS